MDRAHKESPSDSELFVCPWYAGVIVKAYQNLGAKKGGGQGKKGWTKKTHGLNKTLSGVTLASVSLFHATPTPSSATP